MRVRQLRVLCLLLVGIGIFIIANYQKSFFTAKYEVGEDHLRYGIEMNKDAIISLIREEIDIYHKNVSVLLQQNKRQNLPKMTSCSETTRIAFVKIHKTGSSTVTNILQRYGIQRDLNFVIPRKVPGSPRYNYIGMPGESVDRGNIWGLKDGQTYDILCYHVIYNKDAFEKILPNDTVYITLIREPFDQMVSAIMYYRVLNSNGRMGPVENISKYLQNPPKIEPRDPHFSYTNNKQSVDLGANVSRLFDDQYIDCYIKQLDAKMAIVLVLEYFDESLVLLKRRLCWDLVDILYIPKNVNRRRFLKKSYFTATDFENHRSFNSADIKLYKFFLQRLWNQIRNETADFFLEVAHFKKLLKITTGYCKSEYRYRKKLFIPRSEWNREFSLDETVCRFILIGELEFLDKIIEQHMTKHEYYIMTEVPKIDSISYAPESNEYDPFQ